MIFLARNKLKNNMSSNETLNIRYGFMDLEMLHKIESNAGKVMFVLQLIEKQHWIADISVSQTKNNTIAREIREGGSQFYATKDYVKALELYNRDQSASPFKTRKISELHLPTVQLFI